MTDTPRQIVALTDDDTTHYLLPDNPFGDVLRHTVTWATAAGTPLTRHHDRNTHRNGGWWQAPGGIQDITATQPGPSTKVGYRLRDPDTESAKFPATLPVGGLDAQGIDDDAATALYDVVYDRGPDETVTFPAGGMLVVNDAEPAPQDGLSWVVNLPDELRRHPSLYHLFPGHLSGFRAAVVDAANALPVVGPRYLDGACVDSARPSVVQVSTVVPYEPYTTRFVRDTGRNGQKLRRGRDVAETKRLEVSLTVPDRVEGANRVDARARWDAELQRILDVITEALSPAPCWHCQGTGVVARKDVPAPAVSRG